MSRHHFLGQERVSRLVRMFQYKKVGQKFYIPIGLNELKLKSVEKRETKRKGLFMYVIEMWKSPEKTNLQFDKASFKSIQCFHMLTDKFKGNFNSSWYRPFTDNLKEEDFEAFKQHEGKWFNALVKQKEDSAILKDKYDKLREVEFVKPEIVKVFPIDKTDVKFNYLDLYEPLQ